MNSGDPIAKDPAAGVTLSDRDLKLLAHVGKFCISTFEVIHFMFFKGKHRDAVKSTLRRLCGKGPTYRYLHQCRFTGPASPIN